jgi:hypothetical protein
MIDFDPGSFKDPSGRVFAHGDCIYRTLSDAARNQFETAHRVGLIDRLVRQELLVETELVDAEHAGLPRERVGSWLLKQRRIPFVTYSYEWSFEMLRDAAATTLRLMDHVLGDGFVLKDANAFNIVFDGTIPKLIDAPSLELYRDGQVWAGYSQFCRSFLFPLLLTSYRDIDTQLLLRGMMGEVPVQEAAKLLRFRDWRKPGVLKDVVAQARLERSFATTPASVRSATAGQHYPKAMLVANVRRLLKIVEGLAAPRSASEWSDYEHSHSYTNVDHARKQAFVERALTGCAGERVVDLGCNTGEYSELALRSALHVISMDLDPRAIDRLYRRIPKTRALSPVVASLFNPTPSMGWQGKERKSLLERLRAKGFLALALIHHLRISGGVPLSKIVDQLFEIAAEGVIEWVDKSDSMVSRMLSLRPDVYDDYEWDSFEAIVRERAELVAVETTHEGSRRLCYVRLRSSSGIQAALSRSADTR